MYIFQDFWGICACSENRVFPEILNCIEYSFHIQDFWATCACAEKQSVPWIHCIEYIFFIIQNFEQPALALKNTICPKILHCNEIFFIFQDFWAISPCLENSFPWIFQPGGRPTLASHSVKRVYAFAQRQSLATCCWNRSSHSGEQLLARHWMFEYSIFAHWQATGRRKSEHTLELVVKCNQNNYTESWSNNSCPGSIFA